MSTAQPARRSCLAPICRRSFTSVSAIISHLESGNCRSGITTDILNNIITYFPGPKPFLLPYQEAQLRAGCLRREVHPEDFDPRFQKWHCPHCDHTNTKRSKLARHLRSRVCTLGPLQSQRPDQPFYGPLKKPFCCPACKAAFKNLSAVLSHAESGNCKGSSIVSPDLMNLVVFLDVEIEEWGVQMEDNGNGGDDDDANSAAASCPPRQNRFHRDHVVVRSPSRERTCSEDWEDDSVSTDHDEEGGVPL